MGNRPGISSELRPGSRAPLSQGLQKWFFWSLNRGWYRRKEKEDLAKLRREKRDYDWGEGISY